MWKGLDMKSGEMQSHELHQACLLILKIHVESSNITMKNNFLKALSLTVPLLYPISALPKEVSSPGVHKDTDLLQSCTSFSFRLSPTVLAQTKVFTVLFNTYFHLLTTSLIQPPGYNQSVKDRAHVPTCRPARHAN